MQRKRFNWLRVVAVLLVPLMFAQVAAAPVEAHTFHYIWPAENRTVTSHFGWRKKPCPSCSSYHKGMDLAGGWGDPVYAARTGTVTFAGWKRGYGNVVYIKHPGGAETRYAHLNRYSVRKGQKVWQGQRIGEIGATGIGNGRPHLHFEIREYGRPLNPRWLLP